MNILYLGAGTFDGATCVEYDRDISLTDWLEDVDLWIKAYEYDAIIIGIPFLYATLATSRHCLKNTKAVVAAEIRPSWDRNDLQKSCHIILEYIDHEFIMLQLTAAIELTKLHARDKNTDELSINQVNKKVYYRNKEIKLSPSCFKLLNILTLRRGRLVSTENLLVALYGEDHDRTERNVYVFMCLLRKALSEQGCHVDISNVRGEGFIIT